MSINISYFAGAGAQFFDGNGAPLTGGLLYTYLAGTTTPVVTYTSPSGAVNNTNPIVLDAAGRTPAEIWVNGGVFYKFVLKSSTFVTIGTYDNIPAVGDITTITNLITVAGTNALTALATPALGGYAAGQTFSFIAQNNNTAAVTIDIDTLGVKSITRDGSVPLVANDLLAGKIHVIEYDGTRFQLINTFSFDHLNTGAFVATAAQVNGTGYSPNIALTDAATIAWNTALGQTATFTFVSTNRTMGAPTNLKDGAFYALAVIQNTGLNTLTWNAVFKWANGTAPTLSTAAGTKDYFVFRSDGTNLYEQGRSLGVA
jgi:hypothetical protein